MPCLPDFSGTKTNDSLTSVYGEICMERNPGGSINLVPENKTLKKCDITEIDDLKILYK